MSNRRIRTSAMAQERANKSLRHKMKVPEKQL